MPAVTDTPAPARPTATDPVLGYAGKAKAAGQRWGIPTAVLLGLTHVESGGNPNAVSPTGAFGLTQFEPATAAEYGVHPGDTDSMFEGAAHYLHDLGFAHDPTGALAKYNAGAAAGFLQRAGDYPQKVLTAARAYGSTTPVPGAAPAGASPGSSSSGDVLAAHGSDALHGLLWAALAVGGAVLMGLGFARATGLRQSHGAIA
jgi:soluble lytic murein transglycosylase-like protein